MAKCPLQQVNGRRCENEADPESFYDICTDHWSQLIDEHKRVTAEPHRLAEMDCPVCHRRNLVGPGVPFACSNPHCWEDAWWDQPADDAGNPTARGTSWVYYLRFGDRIKIGTSASLKSRLSTLPYDEVIALEPGTIVQERARHQQFETLLVAGQREWFHEDPTIHQLAASLRVEHGQPHKLLGAA